MWNKFLVAQRRVLAFCPPHDESGPNTGQSQLNTQSFLFSGPKANSLQRRHARAVAMLATIIAIVAAMVSIPSLALSIAPQIKYSNQWDTALDAEKAFYDSWIAAYGQVNCSFFQLTWIETATTVNGYIPFSNDCGFGHVLPIPISKVPVCKAPYIPSPATNPTMCVRPDDQTDPNKQVGDPKTCTGNPCDVGSGNKYQAEIDYKSSNAVFPLKLIRSYNSGPVTLSRWGSKWRSNYDRSINVQSSSAKTTAALYRSNGQVFYFNLVGSAWVGEADVVGKLNRQIDGFGNVTGWTYLNPEDEVETYGPTGLLLEIKNKNGARQILTYSCGPSVTATCSNPTPSSVASAPGLLIAVTDQHGRQLKFFYDLSLRVTKVTDPTDAEYLYAYSGTTMNGNLLSVTYPDKKARQYIYGETANTSGASIPNALTGLIDENNARYATWKFDTQGRAISSEHSGGVERVTLSYAANGTASVQDVFGSSVSYQFQTTLGVTQLSNLTRTADNAVSGISYDANGNVSSRTDFNGNVTTYTYDLTRNLETSRVEAAGTPQARTITTQWHATYRLPTRIAEPLRITTNTYDASGNLLSKSVQATSDATGAQGVNGIAVGSPRIWSYTYNTVGQVLTATDPRNGTTTYAYDSMGNLVTITNALNQATTLSQYDANGRVGRMVDANGVTTDLTYSPRGWLLSKVVSGAGGGVETTSYEYDGVGQLTKATLPDGSYVAYTYDAAHRLTTVVDSLGNRITYTLDAMGNRLNEQIQDPNGALSRQTSRLYDALNRLQQVTGGVQ